MQKRRSSLVFKTVVGGFLVMLMVVATADLWGTGGASAISPDGEYCLHVTTALNPNYFSYYTVSLERQSREMGRSGNEISAKKSGERQLPNVGETLETLTIRPHSFPVSCPRGSANPVRWSPGSDFADVYIADKPLCRVYVPR